MRCDLIIILSSFFFRAELMAPVRVWTSPTWDMYDLHCVLWDTHGVGDCL
jgi:hypothetical protein